MNPSEPEGEAVPCPMCEGNCKLQYRVGSSRVWEARYRSKIVTCPVCTGSGWWPRRAWIETDIPATER